LKVTIDAKNQKAQKMRNVIPREGVESNNRLYLPAELEAAV